MANDDLSLPTDQNPSRTTMVPSAPAEQNGDWSGLAVQSAPEDSGLANLAIYLHALRRHWLMALGIGLAIAAVAGPAVWFAIGEKYTATSLLRVSMEENSLLGGAKTTTVNRDNFEIYKNTQQQMLISPFVLMRAVGKPEVRNIPVIRYETQFGDPVRWLEEELSVYFPGRAEVMSVSLSRQDPKEAQALVRSVVDSFMAEVVNAEIDRKRQRLSELENICVAKERELRGKRQELKNLTSEWGASEAAMLNVKQKMVLDELALYRSESAKAQFEMGRAQAELAAQQAMLKSTLESEVPAVELDALVLTDPQAKQLSIELGWKKMDQFYTSQAVKTGTKSGYVTRFDEEVNTLQQQFDARLKELEAKARDKKASEIQMEMLRLEALLASHQQRQAAAADEIAKMRTTAEKFGVISVDVEMLRTDLANMELVAANINNERAKLQIEIRATPRITLLQPAEEPLVPSNTMTRLAAVFLVSVAGLCLPAVAIALWDTRACRINTADDVSKGLRLPVIGSIPLIPPRIIRRLESPLPRYRAWHLRLTESIDGIAARVLHKAEMEQCRAIMVSSANGGEGKTTLATQLALSLARGGRRTVLVDFDLRRPAFDEVFGVPLSPGVSENLRGETEPADLVHSTSTDNLSVVTAGQWDRRALASLSNGGPAALFKYLREEFDFVVVDTSPILPVADARLVSQFVDTVVLSVFRDISQAPKIQAASDILAAFGVHSIEAVVTGPNHNQYGNHMGVEYESTVTAS